MSNIHSWRDSQLFKLLVDSKDSHSHRCQNLLEQVMDDIEKVLAKGNTTPKDFTLHDEGHSFRVAERMVSVACGTKLSSYELMLLLLAAYLHDIGMNPTFKLVDGVHRYLLTGKEEVLAAPERKKLQGWLDDNEYEVTPPISNDVEKDEQLRLAREITTYFCRYRHNDWSGEWIDDKLNKRVLVGYPNWVADLILICKSHHDGYEQLIKSSFDPYKVGGTDPVLVNRRYLALLLRMADILEFDPERVPEVLLEHRGVAPSSLIYWHKDQAISLDLTPSRMVVFAQPADARMHRAIEQTMDGIDAELAICKRVMDECPLPMWFSDEERQRYLWNLPVAVDRDIQPRDDAYEYIDGAFRPDTKKLLELLSGTQIYENKLDAVRELIQNAFDAVAVRIAYEKLSRSNPADPDLAQNLPKIHGVDLKLSTDASGTYLVCSDDGIGMTKAIIRDRVLVSGSRPKHDVRDLERRCREAGIRLDRSGQFGIGILSYFMIADKIEIDTLRAQEAGEPEHAWHFQTEGVGSFGELRRSTRSKAGTTVRLRLSSTEIGPEEMRQSYQEVEEYLMKTMVHCPCRFTFSAQGVADKRIEFAPGWTPRDWTALVAAQFEKTDAEDGGELISIKRKEQIATVKLEQERIIADFRQRIQWKLFTGTLPDGSAEYEVRIPYFELEGGLSLVYLNTRRESEGVFVLETLLDGEDGLLPKPTFEAAWKGMAVNLTYEYLSSSVRLNYITRPQSEIRVHRNSISDLTRSDVSKAMRTLLKDFYKELLEGCSDSPYGWLNMRAVGIPSASLSKVFWSTDSYSRAASATARIRELHFPMVSQFEDYLYSEDKSVALGGQPIQKARCFTITFNGRNYGTDVHLASDQYEADRVLVRDTGQFVAYYSQLPRISERPWRQSIFPPPWADLCGVIVRAGGLGDSGFARWNKEHPLVGLFQKDAWSRCEVELEQGGDPNLYREELLGDASLAACWLAQCLSNFDKHEFLRAVHDNDPSFLRGLLKMVRKVWKADQASRICFSDRGRVLTLTEDGLQENSEPLPNPGESWILRVVDESPDRDRAIY